MFSNDQWSLGRKNREGYHSCAPDEFGRIEEGFGRAGQAVQAAAGRHGEVEGKFLDSSIIIAPFYDAIIVSSLLRQTICGPTVWAFVDESGLTQKKNNIQVVQQ